MEINSKTGLRLIPTYEELMNKIVNDDIIKPKKKLIYMIINGCLILLKCQTLDK